MKINLLSFSIIVCLLLCACIPKHELNTAKSIAHEIGAKSYHVKNNLSGTTPSVELTFEGVSDTGERVTSYCAYTFFKTNSPADLKYDHILINMETKSSKVHRSYTNADMCLVDTLLQGQIQTLFKGYHDSTNYVLSQEFMESTPFHAVAREMAFMDSVYGNYREARIAGFKPDSIQINGVKVPILKIWVRAYYNHRSFPWYLGFFTENKKLILFFGEFNPHQKSYPIDSNAPFFD